jgi:hemerythrin-like metal-binding protein
MDGSVVDFAEAGVTGRLFEGHHHGVDERIRAVVAAMEHSAARAAPTALLGDRLDDLRAFAATHFAAEEKLMEDVFYPQRAEHVRRHRDFLAWLDRLENASRQDPRYIRTPGSVAVLAGWWEAHSLGQDHALTEFLCRGGI